MSDIRVEELWAEMARRKVQFHANEEWHEIDLWGLFTASSIRRQLARGELISLHTPARFTCWVRPSKQAWEEKIFPLIEKHSLAELTVMSGWADSIEQYESWEVGVNG